MMQANSKFTVLLGRDRPLLLDGGLATQLESQGCDIENELWSASLLMFDPEAIVAAHCAYIDAGAECIATASYQASREGFAKIDLPAEEADALMLRSVLLAKEALERREANPDDIAIAASLGPYGAMLHDGSEYTGNYGVSTETLRSFHEPRLQLFDTAGVDVLALETVPSLQEAAVLADLLGQYQTPAWVSFSCRDGTHISDGTPLSQAAALFKDHETVVALGINCTSPEYTTSLIRELRQATPDKFTLAYPNSGETYSATDNSWSGTVSPVDCASAASDWIKAGAMAVGGCCRMGPEHIASMGRLIGKAHSG